MEQKSLQIIEQSSKLFAKKGFSTTSVQEIANECGISKGAFYLHFKSKDALLLAIFNYYFKRIRKRTDEIESLNLDARTTFTKQLLATFEEISNHREFIIMQIREQAIPFNKNIEEFLQQMRFDSYLFYKRHLLAIYGKDVVSVLWEVSILMQGMFKGLLDLIILEDIQLDLEELSRAVLRRTDFIVEGFKYSGDQPVITDSLMQAVIPQGFHSHQFNEIIETLKAFQQKTVGDIEVTIAVLIEELQKQEPRPAIIKGMLSNLEADPQYEGVASQIRAFYNL